MDDDKVQEAVEALLQNRPKGVKEDEILRVVGCSEDQIFRLVREGIIVWNPDAEEVPGDEPLTYRLV